MNSFTSLISSSVLYIGQNAGRTIEEHISHAKKSIKIISPYINEIMVRLLAAKRNQGVDVALLTSDDKKHFSDPENSKVLQEIIIQDRHEDEKKERIRQWLLRVVISIALLCSAVFALMYVLHKLEALITNEYFLKTLVPLLVVEIILIVVWKKIRVYTYTYRTPFPVIFVVDPWKMSKFEKSVYVNNAFYHVKLFIIDDKKAFIGSVNLTTKGMQYNVESLFTIENQAEVQRLTDYFDCVFDQEFFQEDLFHYGRLLYEEPVN